MSLNPGRVEHWVRSTSVLSRTWSKNIKDNQYIFVVIYFSLYVIIKGLNIDFVMQEARYSYIPWFSYK